MGVKSTVAYYLKPVDQAQEPQKIFGNMKGPLFAFSGTRQSLDASVEQQMRSSQVGSKWIVHKSA